jgi:Mg-chelatase subunit ChlD
VFTCEFPEFLLLAIPLGFAFHRWGGFRIDWRWLIPVMMWIGLALVVRLPWWLHVWLLLPLAMSLWPWLRETGVTGGLRLAIVTLLLLSLTGPEWNLGGQGIDVVLVADRSRSITEEAGKNIRELIHNVENSRRVGDRVAVVTFGGRAEVEHDLSSEATLGEYKQEVLPDGSDLNDALLKALELTSRNRPARILVLSDGEANGAPPAFAARRAREAGVPIDFRLFERRRVGDVAVRAIALPEEVSPREPFQFAVEVFADRDAPARVAVLRDGEVIATRASDLYAGSNRLTFRDLVETPGIHNYRVQLEVEGDPLVENNVGAGLVRVNAGPRVLVLNADGQPGNLVRELEAARLPVDVAVAAEHPLTQDSLDPYRAIVIENVPASDFGRIKMERLAQFVEDLGGGLLLTGGQRSFGVGGYFNSPLEDVLPVSMELREEHRKTRVAIAIALDRSGSMMASVRGGKVKMDLANLGTAECVRLLSAGDSVAVIAVDSSPHVIQPLTEVDDTERIAKKVLKIQSEGGGIFVYEALVAAGDELMQASQATKHIILFSDAADSEEPGDYRKLLEQFAGAGITVSVIGLGTKADPDAKLLEDVATRGRGNIMFTDDAEELPRLFTEDTMSVARSSFIEKDPTTQPDGIPGALLPDSRLMGNLLGTTPGVPDAGSVRDAARSFPPADGYNLSYLKPEATAAVVSQDEYAAPFAAFWNKGLGRAAAITLEVDGNYSGAFGRWDHYDDFLITHVRWLLGGNDPGDVFVDIDRQGQDAVITVELDPNRPDRGSGGAPQLIVVPPGEERVARIEPDFTWIGPDTLQARFRMERAGSYRTLVVDRGTVPDASSVRGGPARIARGPAVTLPYSPEFDPREGLPTGAAVLAELAELSGGVARTDVVDVLRNPPRSARTTSLLPWLFSLLIGLLLLEIVGRRLSLWELLVEVVGAAIPDAVKSRGWLPEWRLRLPTRRARRAAAPAPQPSTSPQPPTSPTTPAPPPGLKPPAEKPAIDVFAAAKQRAKRRNQ